SEHPDRAAWNRSLERAVTAHDPQLVVLAGLMKLIRPPLLAVHRRRIINTHPALLPSLTCAHGVRAALAHVVTVTGASGTAVDAGVDTGRILAQVAVDVRDDDTEDTLHQRIKDAEQPLLFDVVPRLSSAS